MQDTDPEIKALKDLMQSEWTELKSVQNGGASVLVRGEKYYLWTKGEWSEGRWSEGKWVEM